MSTDPRKGCLFMKRPRQWREAKKHPPQTTTPVEPVPERTFQFSPRGDLDSFVKFFSGDAGAKNNDPD